MWNLDQLSWTPLCMKPASWSQTGPAGQCRLLSYSAITAFLDRIPHTRLAMNLSRLCRWLALFMIRRYWGFFRWEGRRGRDCGEGGGGRKEGDTCRITASPACLATSSVQLKVSRLCCWLRAALCVYTTACALKYGHIVCNKAIQIQNNWGYFKPCIDWDCSCSENNLFCVLEQVGNRYKSEHCLFS